MRLDLYLVEHEGLSRSRAANLIKLGCVSVNGQMATKVAADIKDNDAVIVSEGYGSSLGGLKLEHALRCFPVSPYGRVCMDVGASNGGFSEVLIRSGAKRVYAIDVGECALPESLRQNDKVVVMDKTNARFLTKSFFDLTPTFAVVDVSFISLTLVLTAIYNSLSENGEVVALVKPQFECEKRNLSKKGIVIDAKKRVAALEKVKRFAFDLGFLVIGQTEAPHPFSEKNIEYLLYLKKQLE
ncbi:MAG: TlyA family RNA methyltransferase [Clostridia bacterium]|nr:TlyA family RNA methyltransferase [Clostridia bacterium]